jgi:hypothetical protein
MKKTGLADGTLMNSIFNFLGLAMEAQRSKSERGYKYFVSAESSFEAC